MIRENISRLAKTVFILCCCVGLLCPQSLVEIAKKEKKRRAALRAKGITGNVVTNADLNKQRRLPIIAVRSQDVAPQGRTPTRRPATPRSPSRTAPQRKVSQETQSRDVYGYRKNATKILFLTGPVKNPNHALSSPDEKFAVISEMGVLDLEFNAKNGPGADIAIYARMAIQQDFASSENKEGGMPIRPPGIDPREGFWYGILGMNSRGEWEEIGRGKGMNAHEEFDLGEIPEIQRIRIMFKPHNNPGFDIKSLRTNQEENTVSIDAVEALH